MKRLLLTAAAVMSLAGPIAATAAYADPPGWDHHDRGPGPGPRDRDWRHDRSDWRDDRRDARWDHDRHNGYFYNNRWYYGPPPAAYYGRPGFSLGYHPWARGQYLPRYYGPNYVIDYRQYRLRPPPRGYHWVRDERGDYILAAIAGGLIADVIINSR